MGQSEKRFLEAIKIFDSFKSLKNRSLTSSSALYYFVSSHEFYLFIGCHEFRYYHSIVNRDPTAMFNVLEDENGWDKLPEDFKREASFHLDCLYNLD